MLIDVLRTAAEEAADTPAVVARGRSITYGELVARGERLAAGLQARGVDRFGCAVQDPIGVVELLAAASAAGSEACVYPRNLDAPAVAALAARLGHTTVLADELEAVDGVQVLTAGDLAAEAGAGSATTPPDPTVLIMTTGTTGAPKGVRHEWARLVRTVRPHEQDRGSRWLLAYNVNQFAAFQVLLHAFVHRATVVVPASAHARDAIEAMYEAQVTHVSATPTFWRMLLGSLAAEPRPLALEQITLGGEASPASVIDRLRETFPDARISHVYAGTEFGSAVSVRDGRSGLPLSVLDRDESADVQFRVVDGELHVRSRNAMLGYHGGDEAQEWHATGDLVEARDGRLHFVGRTVEIINVAGAKIHPLPLEELIVTVPGVAAVAVYGKPSAITGQIVAADVVLEDGADGDEVQRAIHQACGHLPPPGRPRRLRLVDALEVRGNKVVRQPQEVSS